jgi:hypothetical protein
LLGMFNFRTASKGAGVSRRIALPGLLLAALTVAAACNGTSGTPSAPGRRGDANTGSAASATRDSLVRDSVKALLHLFTDRMNAGDLAGAGALYSDDSTFSWVENGALRYPNAKSVRESLLTLKNIPKITLVYYETHVDVLAPGVATVRTEFSQTFYDQLKHGTTYGGFLTATLVHEPGGWKMRNGHTSSRRPRPE